MLFYTYGGADKPTLLLIPGLGVSHEIFLPLIELIKIIKVTLPNLPAPKPKKKSSRQ